MLLVPISSRYQLCSVYVESLFRLCFLCAPPTSIVCFVYVPSTFRLCSVGCVRAEHRWNKVKCGQKNTGEHNLWHCISLRWVLLILELVLPEQKCNLLRDHLTGSWSCIAKLGRIFFLALMELYIRMHLAMIGPYGNHLLTCMPGPRHPWSLDMSFLTFEVMLVIRKKM